ncbi:MAG: hypothetical protein IPP65_06635 [Chlorobi bacterium]|nr:hypothetical protein [Chlorobiota bacterium]
MIIRNPEEDYFHNIGNSGGYEWSYFDGLSNDGLWGFTAIWFKGCPMSPHYTKEIDYSFLNGSHINPEDFSAFSFSLYYKGVRKFWCLNEANSSHSTFTNDSPNVSFNENILTCKVIKLGKEFEIEIHSSSATGTKRVAGRISLSFPDLDLKTISNTSNNLDDNHNWVPANLVGSFNLNLHLYTSFGLKFNDETIDFSGRSYHDRNYGLTPLHKLDVDWFWGRYIGDEYSLVYFKILSKEKKEIEFSQLLLFKNHELLYQSKNFDFIMSHSKKSWTLKYPSRILISNDDIKVEVNESYKPESGPFYHRFVSDFKIYFKNNLVSGKGITEFLKPKRLGIKSFRPFIKFRVRRT